jgi:hypothetical protein
VGNSAEIERRLAEAWTFLAGQQLEFRRVDPPQDRPLESNDWQVLLPFFDDFDQDSACRLTITALQARRAAATLFGVSESEVTQADVEDAMREAGNILGACLLEGREFLPRLGLPTIMRVPMPFELLSQYEPEADPYPRIDEIRPQHSNTQRPLP